MAKDTDGTVQDYLKIFLVSLVTSVAVLFVLGPVMMKMNAQLGPRPQAEAATPAADTPPSPAAEAELTAPNLQGLSLREARERWRAEGIVVIEDSQRIDPSAEPGTILSQNPAGGAPLQSKEIRVVVSAAPEMVTVPGVLGKDVAEATEELVKAGFEVPAPEKQPSEEELNTVLSQEPNAGSKSEKGSLVRLVVAEPPEAAGAGEADTGAEAGADASEIVEVPRVLGMPIDRARKEIEQAGLVVGSVSEREDEELSNRRVLSQSPRKGTKVASGSSVDLVIVAPD